MCTFIPCALQLKVMKDIWSCDFLNYDFSFSLSCFKADQKIRAAKILFSWNWLSFVAGINRSKWEKMMMREHFFQGSIRWIARTTSENETKIPFSFNLVMHVQKIYTYMIIFFPHEVANKFVTHSGLHHHHFMQRTVYDISSFWASFLVLMIFIIITLFYSAPGRLMMKWRFFTTVECNVMFLLTPVQHVLCVWWKFNGFDPTMASRLAVVAQSSGKHRKQKVLQCCCC